MNQIEGGTLIVNKGEEAKPRPSAEIDPNERNLNLVDGLEEGWKLANVSRFPALSFYCDSLCAHV
jgi:hypothetical protein